jgi:DNA-binding LacI/PurR family transcriptional regulator
VALVLTLLPVGFGDAPIATLTDPPMTTVRQPVYQRT